MMTVIVIDEKSVEFQKIEPGLSNKSSLAKDVFGDKVVSMTCGIGKFSKGTVIDANFDFDDFLYILSGTQRFEEGGITYIAKKGAFVHLKRGSKVKQTIEEDSVELFVTVPKHELGNPRLNQ